MYVNVKCINLSHVANNSELEREMSESALGKYQFAKIRSALAIEL
jgi:hypothetical protein